MVAWVFRLNFSSPSSPSSPSSHLQLFVYLRYRKHHGGGAWVLGCVCHLVSLYNQHNETSVMNGGSKESNSVWMREYYWTRRYGALWARTSSSPFVIGGTPYTPPAATPPLPFAQSKKKKKKNGPHFFYRGPPPMPPPPLPLAQSIFYFYLFSGSHLGYWSWCKIVWSWCKKRDGGKGTRLGFFMWMNLSWNSWQGQSLGVFIGVLASFVTVLIQENW